MCDPQIKVFASTFDELARIWSFGDAKGFLDTVEFDRFSRFATQGLSYKFALGRAAAKTLIGHEFQQDPRDLSFEYTSFGRPYLSTGIRHFDFNIAHSGSWLMVAFSHQLTVGVDIEDVDQMRDWRSIAERYFDMTEADLLKSLPAHLQWAGFLRIWTAKEALLKCRGTGLSGGLNTDRLIVENDKLVLQNQKQRCHRVRELRIPDAYAAVAWASATNAIIIEKRTLEDCLASELGSRKPASRDT